jgi:hypothetical protein
VKTSHTFFVLLFIFKLSFSQDSGSKTLLIGEFFTDKNDEQYQYLIGLKFSNGRLLKRDTISYGPTFKKKNGDFESFFRIDFKNTIYSNRYLITFGGMVVDLKLRKILKEEDGDLIKSTNDTLTFFTENLFRGVYYTFLDLKTGNVSKKEIKNYKRDFSDNIKAPSGNREVYVDYSELPYRIFLITKGKKELLVSNAGYATPLKSTGSFPLVPIHWIDSARFLYVRFDMNRLKWNYTGSVILYNTKSKSEQIIGFLGTVKEFIVNAKFFVTPENGLLLRSENNHYKIIADSPLVEKISKYQLPHLFSYAFFSNDDWKQKLYYHDEYIGEYHFLDTHTTSNYLALGMRDKGTYTGADKIGIWNTFTKQWLIIHEPKLIDIIGWIDEN